MCVCVCSLCVNEIYFIDVSVSSCTNSLCVPLHHIEEYMMELFNSVILVSVGLCLFWNCVVHFNDF